MVFVRGRGNHAAPQTKEPLMKTYEMLCEHTGEISYTRRDEIAIWTGQVDLSEKKQALVSNDMWEPILVDRYELRKIELPDWLKPQEWIRDRIAWKFTWGFGVDQDWPEDWQLECLRMKKDAGLLAVVKLLKTKKFRSGFRKSLHDQLIAWLGTPKKQRAYGSPFSPRQWESLVNGYLIREAEATNTHLYYSQR
jgi:hypothetical protein